MIGRAGGSGRCVGASQRRYPSRRPWRRLDPSATRRCDATVQVPARGESSATTGIDLRWPSLFERSPSGQSCADGAVLRWVVMTARLFPLQRTDLILVRTFGLVQPAPRHLSLHSASNKSDEHLTAEHVRPSSHDRRGDRTGRRPLRCIQASILHHPQFDLQPSQHLRIFNIRLLLRPKRGKKGEEEERKRHGVPASCGFSTSGKDPHSVGSSESAANLAQKKDDACFFSFRRLLRIS